MNKENTKVLLIAGGIIAALALIIVVFNLFTPATIYQDSYANRNYDNVYNKCISSTKYLFGGIIYKTSIPNRGTSYCVVQKEYVVIDTSLTEKEKEFEIYLACSDGFYDKLLTNKWPTSTEFLSNTQIYGECIYNKPLPPTIIKTCTDSDGGENKFVKGTVDVCENNNCDSIIDSCYSNNQLTEAGCNGNSAYTTAFNCINGCRDGVCLQTAPIVQKTCSDSDNGEDKYTKGTTIQCINGHCDDIITDSCYGLSQLTEAACNDNGMYTTAFICDNDCVDGACIRNTNTTNNTDDNTNPPSSIHKLWEENSMLIVILAVLSLLIITYIKTKK